MPEIKQVNAILANPSPSDPNGRVTAGHYILEDGLLTMVDADGKPLRGTGGEKIVHRMQDGENPDSIACRLTLMLYRRGRRRLQSSFKFSTQPTLALVR